MTAEEYDRYAEKIYLNTQKKTEELYASYIKELKENLEDECKQIISDFYSEYEPYIYDRTGDLKNVFKIEVEMNKDGQADLLVKLSSDFMKHRHRANNDYIYSITIREGWHGGASKIADSKIDKWGKHPQTGTPYYRTPVPHYTEWGRPAVVSDMSPLAKMNVNLQKVVDKLHNKYQKKYTKIILAYYKELETLEKQLD